MSVDVVVFDIGRVLIEWDPQAMYDARIGAERRERLFAEVDLDGMNLGVDRGDDLDAAVEALAARHPDWAAEIRMWRDNWLEMVPGPIEGPSRCCGGCGRGACRSLPCRTSAPRPSRLPSGSIPS
ncbi:MAG: hypothetical protein ACE368_04795 [Paracoccaceae bacterium]